MPLPAVQGSNLVGAADNAPRLFATVGKKLLEGTWKREKEKEKGQGEKQRKAPQVPNCPHEKEYSSK